MSQNMLKLNDDKASEVLFITYFPISLQKKPMFSAVSVGTSSPNL